MTFAKTMRPVPVLWHSTKPCSSRTSKLSCDCFSRAVRQAKLLDAEGDARERGETPKCEIRLAAWVQAYVVHVRDDLKHAGWRNVEDNLQSFVRLVGDRQLRSLKRADVEQYLARRAQEVRPTTANGGLKDAKRALHVAVERGHLEANPAAGVRPMAARPLPVRLPEEGEVAKLLRFFEARKGWLYPLVVTLIATGCRAGEALQLDWSDLDFAIGKLTLKRNKVQDVLVFDLVDPLRGVLEGCWMAQNMPGKGRVFLTEDGGPLTRTAALTGLKRCAKKAGMEWVTLKMLRKLAATAVMEATGDIRKAQALLGHTSIRTTMLYLGREQEARQGAVAATSGYLNRVVGTFLGTSPNPSIRKATPQALE